MKHLPGRSADERCDLVFPVRGTAFAPLLELDDHRVVGVCRPLAGDHEIEPAGGEGKLVLEHHAVVEKVPMLEDARHGAERILPGGDFGGGGIVTIIVKESVFKLAGDLVQVGVVDELS
jgi:hypothetical protein